MNRRNWTRGTFPAMAVPETMAAEILCSRAVIRGWRKNYAPPPSSTAIWVVLFAISMMFAAFTSALVVRKGSSPDWRTFKLPSILFVNTLVLLASSITLEVSRRQIAGFMGGLREQLEKPTRWLYVTLMLGLLFVAGQYVAWAELRTQGLYLATNPSSSFFYVLTVTHALHVLGGLAGLGLCDTETGYGKAEAEHAGCSGTLLAFHGSALGVPARAAVGETLEESTD